MSALATARASASREFDRHLKPRERWSPRFRLSLRRRSADHPMAMFATIALAVLASAALMPPAGLILGPSGAVSGAAVQAASRDLPATGPRLVQASDTDIACRGQAWGAESAGCLAVIARESGRGAPQTVRLIAAGEPAGTAPNIF
jgi:hypothetical protein